LQPQAAAICIPPRANAILPALPDLAPGVYHYGSRDHCLERRCFPGGRPPRSSWARALPADSLLVGLFVDPLAPRRGNMASGLFATVSTTSATRIATVALRRGLRWAGCAVLLDSPADDEVAAVLGT